MPETAPDGTWWWSVRKLGAWLVRCAAAIALAVAVPSCFAPDARDAFCGTVTAPTEGCPCNGPPGGSGDWCDRAHGLTCNCGGEGGWICLQSQLRWQRAGSACLPDAGVADASEPADAAPNDASDDARADADR